SPTPVAGVTCRPTPRPMCAAWRCCWRRPCNSSVSARRARRSSNSKPSLMASTQLGSVLERTVLKEGQLFIVADRDGDIKALNLEGQGLYYRDRRHLSLFEMAVNGTRLTLLSSAGELNFMSTMQFSNDLLLGPDG